MLFDYNELQFLVSGMDSNSSWKQLIIYKVLQICIVKELRTKNVMLLFAIYDDLPIGLI